MMRIIFAWAAFLAMLPASLGARDHAPAGPLAPRDLCSGNPELSAFDAKLKQAVAKRDANALMRLASDDVLLDFGGGSGKDEWRKRLAEGTYNSWDDLAATIRLGCTLKSETTDIGTNPYAAYPWYFAGDVVDGDPYETAIVTGEDVLIRSGPSRDAPVIGSLSWDWVSVSFDGERANGYSAVTTQRGLKGYMAEKYLRSLVDYRLIVEPVGEGWQISNFVAGD